MDMRFCGDSDQAIVPLRFAILSLFGFDYAQQPRLDQATAERRLIHQNQHIERIAVICFRSGD